MPPVSEAQRKAMHAAAAGKSTIGIPKSVGKEFSDADKGGKLPKKAKSKYDRSSHNKGNPGFPSSHSHSPPRHEESAVKSKKTEAAHEAREKQVMGAGYEEHERGFSGHGHESPQSMAKPKGFDHKQLKGCFLAEHHRAVDISRTPDRFRGTRNSGPVLRVSGHKGAHQIGKK